MIGSQCSEKTHFQFETDMMTNVRFPVMTYNMHMREIPIVLFVYTYSNAYIHLRFKHAALGTHLSCLGYCLGQ